MSSEPEVAAAILAVTSGNCEAYRFIVTRYRRPILSFIFNITRNPEHVEDIGQEVFLKAYQALSGFRPEGGTAFSTWLFTIARNTCIDHLRKRKSPQAAPGTNGFQHAEQMAEEKHGPEGILLTRELRRELDLALDSLPREQRMAVEWTLVQDFSYEEAAKLEKISVGTLSSRLARAKEKLQKRLSRYMLGGRADEIQK